MERGSKSGAAVSLSYHTFSSEGGILPHFLGMTMRPQSRYLLADSRINTEKVKHLVFIFVLAQ
jgi:hypothetical protein